MSVVSGRTTSQQMALFALALGTAISLVTALPGLGQQREVEMRLQGMGGMGWGMALIGVLVLVLLVLGIAALVKYLMSGNK